MTEQRTMLDADGSCKDRADELLAAEARELRALDASGWEQHHGH